MSLPLAGKVAIVAGATRGAGRGIACMLGEAGATVYCTGRSTRGHPATPGRPETIEETAEMVAARGGVGLWARVDHTRPAEVEAFMDRVRREQGGADILVNDIWGGDAITEFGKSFWELNLQQGFELLERAVFSHIITSRFAAPLLFARPRALIVEITDGDFLSYRGNLFYDLAKNSVIRLAIAMEVELRRTQVTAVAVTPGYLRSEEMLDRYGVSEANWRDAVAREPDFIESETPFYVGRAVAALAADPEVKRRSGEVLASWDLAREYGFTDVDGRQPHWVEYFERKYGPYRRFDEGLYAYIRGGPFERVFENWPSTPEN